MKRGLLARALEIERVERANFFLPRRDREHSAVTLVHLAPILDAQSANVCKVRVDNTSGDHHIVDRRLTDQSAVGAYDGCVEFVGSDNS